MVSVTDKSKLTPEEMLEHAETIIQTAKEIGVTLRIVGGIAVLEAVRAVPEIFRLLLNKRTAGNTEAKFGDIDMVGYSKETRKMNDIFIDRLHFTKDKIVNSLFGDVRRIYYDPNRSYHVDIFLDKLDFNHQIDFRGRLEMQYPNLNYADLFLSKLQIHHPNEKDLLDILALMTVAEREGTGWKERMFAILADDWGFYYDAVRNFEAAGQQARAMITGSQDDPVIQRAEADVARFRAELDSAPKTKNWEKRMKKGTDKQWWKDVEDVLR